MMVDELHQIVLDDFNQENVRSPAVEALIEAQKRKNAKQRIKESGLKLQSGVEDVVKSRKSRKDEVAALIESIEACIDNRASGPYVHIKSIEGDQKMKHHVARLMPTKHTTAVCFDRDLKAYRCVGLYIGKYYTEAEYDELSAGNNTWHKYATEFKMWPGTKPGSYLMVDATELGNQLREMNHYEDFSDPENSPQPNARLIELIDYRNGQAMPYIAVITLADVSQHQECLLDYGDQYFKQMIPSLYKRISRLEQAMEQQRLEYIAQVKRLRAKYGGYKRKARQYDETMSQRQAPTDNQPLSGTATPAPPATAAVNTFKPPDQKPDPLSSLPASSAGAGAGFEFDAPGRMAAAPVPQGAVSGCSPSAVAAAAAVGGLQHSGPDAASQQGVERCLSAGSRQHGSVEGGPGQGVTRGPSAAAVAAVAPAQQDEEMSPVEGLLEPVAGHHRSSPGGVQPVDRIGAGTVCAAAAAGTSQLRAHPGDGIARPPAQQQLLLPQNDHAPGQPCAPQQQQQRSGGPGPFPCATSPHTAHQSPHGSANGGQDVGCGPPGTHAGSSCAGRCSAPAPGPRPETEPQLPRPKRQRVGLPAPDLLHIAAAPSAARAVHMHAAEGAAAGGVLPVTVTAGAGSTAGGADVVGPGPPAVGLALGTMVGPVHDAQGAAPAGGGVLGAHALPPAPCSAACATYGLRGDAAEQHVPPPAQPQSRGGAKHKPKEVIVIDCDD